MMAQPGAGIRPATSRGAVSALARRVDAAERRRRGARGLPDLDPLGLAQLAGITPDPWQAEVLTTAAPRVLLNCSRQAGKSTVTACLAVHTALTTPGALVLLLSPTQRQSAELFRKAADVYRAAGAIIPADAESALRLELANGARVVSLPGKELTVRGYSGVALLVIDEAARVPDSLYLSVRPMLAVSRGRLMALSTPFGTRGWWFDAWRDGGEAWARWEVPATDCPRITADFLDEERRTLGPWWFAQEYECTFMDAQSQAFRRADIDAAFAEPVESWAL